MCDVEALPASGEMHIEFGPFPLALGRPVPAQARGWVGRSGYGIAVHGDGEVSHTLRMASLLGLQAVKGERGRRGADGFADWRNPGRKTNRAILRVFLCRRWRERCNCTTFAHWCGD